MSAADLARLVADLAGRGGRLLLDAEGRLLYRGPPLPDEVRALLREHAEVLKEFMVRERFRLDELAAFGFLGELDGEGLYVVRPARCEPEGLSLLRAAPSPPRGRCSACGAELAADRWAGRCYSCSRFGGRALIVFQGRAAE